MSFILKNNNNNINLDDMIFRQPKLSKTLRYTI